MSEDIFDLIIVGAGPAGSAAALVAARAGLETLVVERGNFPGAKNMTGGRLYGHSLESLVPNFADEAPIERIVTREKVSLLTRTDMVSMEYAAPPSKEASKRSYTVLRSKFDQWLFGKAEEAGAQLIPGVRVEEVLQKDGKVIGIRAGEDDLYAHVVILADGVNSILAQSIGMAKPIPPAACAVGAKEVLEFSPEVMRDRFNCHGREGMAWLFAGDPTDGRMGGGFLYTNEDTISLGLVFGLSGLVEVKTSVPQMLENFKAHPAIAPLLEGGKLVEYSGHVVPEAGLDMMPTLVGDGVLIAGDAAGFCLNVGYTVRGMDLAIESGRLAAGAAIEAKQKNDFSAQTLDIYQKSLVDSFVIKDLRLYANLPTVLENPRIFTEYPQMAADIMQKMFTIDGPSSHLRTHLFGAVRNTGMINMARDIFRIMGAI